MSEENKNVTPEAPAAEAATPETPAAKKHGIELPKVSLPKVDAAKVDGAKSKIKNFFGEFEKFALKGNVMDLAVGVIIGAAFQNIVKALTDNIINPLIGLLFQANLDTVGLRLHFGDKVVFFGFGAFVSAIINFVIMAFVLFCLLKFVNNLLTLGKKKEEEAPAEPAAPTQEELLAEILAELKAQSLVMQEPAE